jgi:hypothetical protein
MTRVHRRVISVLTSCRAGINHFLEFGWVRAAEGVPATQESRNVNVTATGATSAVAPGSVTFDSWRVLPFPGKEQA